MAHNLASSQTTPLGQIALYERLGLDIPPPVVRSYARATARRGRELTSHTEEYYPIQYRTNDTLLDNLKFALKHEPLDLRIIYESLLAIGPRALEEWVREAPSKKREERFLQALRSVVTFNPNDKAALIALQQSIVDPRYAAQDWRTTQNFVSETTRQFGQDVHYVCPRPSDVPALMQGWMALTERLMRSRVDAVLAAAVSGFGFVFIHPFEDGNGRIHRFMVHYALAKLGFSPPGIVFPVSAAILRNKLAYEQALDSFSGPLMQGVDWIFTPDGDMEASGNTIDVYRFFDATALAEYLFDRVAETVRIDFKEELDFLETYDAAYSAVTGIVDMPTRRAALLVKLCMQNAGHLSKNKRKDFNELTDDEVDRIQRAVKSVLDTGYSMAALEETDA